MGQVENQPGAGMAQRPPAAAILALVAGIVLLPVACSDKAPDDASPSGQGLTGVWAWKNAMNCYFNENTISFRKDRIEVHLHGNLELSVAGPAIERAEIDGLVEYRVGYALNGQRYVETYQMLDPNTLKVAGTTVDGEPGLAMRSVGKVLVRCPPDTLNEGSSAPLAPPAGAAPEARPISLPPGTDG